MALSSPPTNQTGIIYAVLGAICAGAFIVPWKKASDIASVPSMVLVMLSTAAVFNTGMLFVPGIRDPDRPVEWRLMILLGLIFAILSLTGNSGSAAAVTELSASVVSVLIRTEVILVAILGWLLLGERVPLAFWVGVLLAGAGLLIVQAPTTSGSQTNTMGLLYALAAAGSFATMGVLTRRYITRVDPVGLNTLRLWGSVVLWFAFEGPHLPRDLTLSATLYAVLAAILGPFLGRLFLMFSARTLEARTTSMITLTGPVWSVLIAGVVLGEVLEWNEIVGGALLLSGVSIPVITRFHRTQR
ncbi:MAG: DMT family transporter [Myxococcota bacterium]